MRKGRVIAILCLSLILCFMCLVTNTFSWFNRTEESGKSIVLSDRTYKQSSGKDYTVKTCEMGTGDYTTVVKDNKISNLTISGGSRQCFKTQIKSNNTSKQNVSLYLSGVKSSNVDKTYIGVNTPMRTYKNIATSTESPKSATINKRNIYVAIERNAYSLQPTNYYLHWWNSTTNGNQPVTGHLHKEDYVSGDVHYNVYHAEIPYEATKVKPFIRENGVDNYGTNLQEFSLSNCNFVGIYRYNGGSITGSIGSKIGETAGLKSFYSEATVQAGSSIDLVAEGQGTITYSSNDSDVTVDNNGHVIASKNITSEKTVDITVTSTGALGDTQKYVCKLKVKPIIKTLSIAVVPVVTNMEISKYDSETDQNIVTVYWYLKNIGTSDITVSVDKINVTL